MPQVSEIATGSTFSRSSEGGIAADQTNRVFRVIGDAPGASVDVQTACGVRIGDVHPQNSEVYCTSFDVRYDGDSRIVLLVTFNYAATPSSQQNQDRNSQPPDIRPGNFTTSTSLIETPVYKWWPRTGVAQWGSETEATNAAGDMYEGIAQLTGMVNIQIVQEFSTDPTTHNQYTGYINDEEITLGTLVMAPHTVMFRGVQSQPYAESWGTLQFRGWKATYEFAYRKNRTKLAFYDSLTSDATESEVDLGWDIAVPQSGHNVKAFNPQGANTNDDIFGQPLRHGDAQSSDSVMQQFAGVVIPPPNGYLLPEGVNIGDRMPAMVKVFSYENGNKGCSQARASSPIPLNPNGRPRKESSDPKVIVAGYQVQPSINFTTTLGLRLG